MNHQILFRVFVFAAVMTLFTANAADVSSLSAESLRSAPRSEKAVNLPRQLSDVGHMMPMFEIAVISRLCASPKLQAQIGKSRNDCAKAMYQVRQACTNAFHQKFPRSDGEEIDGRLSYQNFAAGYMQCLKDEYVNSENSRQ